MRRLTLANLWAHKRRAVGTALAVVLGVAFLCATLVLGDTLDRTYAAAFERANAGTAAIVRSATAIDGDDGPVRAPIDADLADRVAAVPGVAAVAPEVRATAQVEGRDGRPVGGDGPPTTAEAWIADPQLNAFHVTSGHAPARAGEAVLDRSTATEAHLRVGDRFTIRTPERVSMRLVGLVSFGSQPDMAGTTYIGLDPAQARTLLTAPGTVTDLRVRGDGTRTDAQLATAIERALPRGVESVTAATLTSEQVDAVQGAFAGFVKTFLLAFAAVAVVVATFTIANTFAIVGAQRSRESALLRAVGATRRQVLAATLAESVIIGAIASAIGLGVGVVLAIGLRAALTSFGLDLSATALVVAPRTLIIGLTVGVLSTLVAAVVPAVRSSRTAPIDALRDSAAEVAVTSWRRALIGTAVAGLGGALVVTATSAATPMARAGLGALAALVGVVVLGAVIARPAASAIGAPIALARGVPGTLARRNAMRNPRRTAGAALALVIGAAIVALFATFGASIRHSIDQTVSRSFGGDLVMAKTDFSGADIPPQVAASVRQLPEVANTVALDDGLARVGGTTVYPTATDPAALARLVDLDVKRGSLAEMRSGQVAVADAYATDHHLRIGSPLTLTYADGERATLRVAATYGVRELLGDIVMTTHDWAPHADRPGDVAVLVGLRDGVTLDQGRRAVEAVADRYGAPDVQDRDQYVQRVAGQVDQLLVLVYGLLGLAVIIALIGLGNALSLSIHERTRELGLLRAIGLARGELRSSVRWEAVITAVVGTTIGLGLGTFLGWGLVRALAAQEGFVSFQAPGGSLAVVLALSVTAGVVAAIRPARRAARLDVLQAIADR